MLETYKVKLIGAKVPNTGNNPNANQAWRGIIKIKCKSIDVILKNENSIRLVKELLAIQLASFFEVPHIKGWVVSIDQKKLMTCTTTPQTTDPNKAGHYLLFASKLSDGGPLVESGKVITPDTRKRYLTSSDALAIMVFDELVANTDRIYQNVMEEPPRFLAFDHDKILFGDSVTWSQLPLKAGENCEDCDMGGNVAYAAPSTKVTVSDIAQSWAKKLGTLIPIPILAKLANAGLLGDSDVQAIERFLIDRLSQLHCLVRKHYP